MKYLLRFLCALSVLAATGYSLLCTVCLASGAASCTGKTETCPPGTVCGSSYTVKMEGGIKVKEFSGRTCTPPSQCSEPGSFSTNSSKFKKGFSCCSIDNCTPPAPKLPADNYQTNGVICPTCTSNVSDNSCNTQDTIHCTGNENMCILQITKMTGALSSSEVLRGCASQSICNIGKQSVNANGINIDVDITCTSGSHSLQHVFIFQVMFTVLFLKLLY